MNAYNQYRSYQVETAAPEDQVALLYDGARRFTDQALAALEANMLDVASQKTGKAQAILSELSASLNYEAGEMAKNLFLLYDYWGWRLGQGLIKHDPEAFREVSATLMDMHAAWVDAARQVRAQKATRSIG